MRSLLLTLTLLIAPQGDATAQDRDLRAALGGIEHVPAVAFFRSLDTSEITTLIAIYNDPSAGPGMRARALAGLQHIDSNAATRTLVQAIRSSRPLFARVAIRALETRGQVGQRAIGIALTRPERSVRHAAVRALIHLGTPTAMQTLRRHKSHEPDRRLRTLIARRLRSSR